MIRFQFLQFLLRSRFTIDGAIITTTTPTDLLMLTENADVISMKIKGSA